MGTKIESTQRKNTWKIKEVPISATVKLKNANSFSAIKHKDLSRVVTVYSPILAGYNANEVFLNVKKAIETGFEGFKSNVSYSFTGEIAEQEGHHPDIWFGWGYAKIKIFTHAIKGLHESDFVLAAKIDNIN